MELNVGAKVLLFYINDVLFKCDPVNCCQITINIHCPRNTSSSQVFVSENVILIFLISMHFYKQNYVYLLIK